MGAGGPGDDGRLRARAGTARGRGLSGAADIHVHALPGVDDGPATMSEALALLRALLEDGSTVVACTPHVREAVVAEIPERVDALARAARDDGLDIELMPGGEVAFDDVSGLSDEELDAVSLGPADARWVLLECPFLGSDPSPLARAADELRARGRDLVLAHPERSAPVFAERGAPLRREVDRGAVVQVNAPSVIGDHGPEVRERAMELIADDIPVVVASDAHSAVRRPPSLRAARRELIDVGLPESRVEWLTARAPSRLVARGVAGVR